MFILGAHLTALRVLPRGAAYYRSFRDANFCVIGLYEVHLKLFSPSTEISVVYIKVSVWMSWLFFLLQTILIFNFILTACPSVRQPPRHATGGEGPLVAARSFNYYYSRNQKAEPETDQTSWDETASGSKRAMLHTWDTVAPFHSLRRTGINEMKWRRRGGAYTPCTCRCERG